MSAPRVYIFVNGILAWPGDSEGWTDRATTWTNINTPHKAEKWEYATGPFLRRLWQQKRAEKIATLIAHIQGKGFEVVLGGHSNGCDIIARVLALRGTKPWYFAKPVRSVHLFAAAADAEPFLEAFDARSVGRIFIYRGGKDRALQFGRWTRRLFGWAGLGYGTLGLEDDPDDSAAIDLEFQPGVVVHVEPGYKHSTWFLRGEVFEGTMRRIMRAEEAPETSVAFADQGEPGPGV